MIKHIVIESGGYKGLYVLGALDELNKSKYNPLGKGNHQTSINAGIVKRMPISKYGGKYCIAGLAITKPKPKNIGTRPAIKESRSGKYYFL